MHQNKTQNRDKNVFFRYNLWLNLVPDFRGKSILFAGWENLTSHLCGGYGGLLDRRVKGGYNGNIAV